MAHSSKNKKGQGYMRAVDRPTSDTHIEITTENHEALGFPKDAVGAFIRRPDTMGQGGPMHEESKRGKQGAGGQGLQTMQKQFALAKQFLDLAKQEPFDHKMEKQNGDGDERLDDPKGWAQSDEGMQDAWERADMLRDQRREDESKEHQKEHDSDMKKLLKEFNRAKQILKQGPGEGAGAYSGTRDTPVTTAGSVKRLAGANQLQGYKAGVQEDYDRDLHTPMRDPDLPANAGKGKGVQGLNPGGYEGGSSPHLGSAISDSTTGRKQEKMEKEFSYAKAILKEVDPLKSGESFTTLNNYEARKQEHDQLLREYGFPSEQDPEANRYSKFAEVETDGKGVVMHNKPPWIVAENSELVSEINDEDAPSYSKSPKAKNREGADTISLKKEFEFAKVILQKLRLKDVGAGHMDDDMRESESWRHADADDPDWTMMDVEPKSVRRIPLDRAQSEHLDEEDDPDSEFHGQPKKTKDQNFAAEMEELKSRSQRSKGDMGTI